LTLRIADHLSLEIWDIISLIIVVEVVHNFSINVETSIFRRRVWMGKKEEEEEEGKKKEREIAK
jgi:hypothetical protein